MRARAAAAPGGPIRRLVLVGNPNVGKSVIFGILTGTYVTVSNYPGTTVEVSRGHLPGSDSCIAVIDTPGTNSLVPNSEDERVTRDILFESANGTAVLQVGDAKNLSRTLALTLQLAETGLPVFLCLNMSDEARSRGIEIDGNALSSRLGIPVASTVAPRRQGTEVLFKAPALAAPVAHRPRYSELIEKHARDIEARLPGSSRFVRSAALMLLAGDRSLAEWLFERLDDQTVDVIDTCRRTAETSIDMPLSYAIAVERMKAAEAIAHTVTTHRKATQGAGRAQRLGELMTRPFAGSVILLFVLVLLYLLVGHFGAQTLVGLLEDGLFGKVVNPAAIALMDRLAPFPHEHIIEAGRVTTRYVMVGGSTGGLTVKAARLVHDLVVGEYGLLTMALSYSLAIVFPIVMTFFFAFGILEDSGYMPRLAVIVNKAFSRFGLNGKAILPLILGLGCDTMATLTTRLLETRKERLIVILLLTLGVPCSAQLGVIFGILGTLPVPYTLVWASVILGSLALTGYGASRILPGEKADFIMELPPLRIPGLKNIAVKTLARVEWYLKEAVPLFILGTVVLFVLDRLALLTKMRALAAPVVVRCLDLPPEAADAFLIGFLRRDFGAAGLYALAAQGRMDHVQTLTGLVTITLFVPCIAQFFITIKERGLRTALAIAAFVFPFAIVVGSAVNFLLRLAGAGR